ncbi:PTS glucose transporter subunit IIA [Spiroplasma culicicola]|uniref:PTS system beta-glucoside-specific IIABC component n=1 Tax=Spiroplasma culicicola AES-1 TaxID=1276246 RepID=W6AGY4_9MOLU|nr:PTS glucose transporter subunit IIA [Spiroplasma culicicola]AHI52949.1 PTS system beta-glucoside-specific IIABC component [Spiroplasma culicicola AES-1]
MQKIKIYAPVDGYIDSIDKLNDGVFSQKLLGDGFYIRASGKEKKDFFSPIEMGKVKFIAESLHAIFFELEKDLSILMHIGLDTVSLDGKPFSNAIEIESDVNLSKRIISVDINYINNAGLDHVCPITINSESDEYRFNILKVGDVKQGELIGEFELINKNDVLNKIIDPKEFFAQDNKFAQIAKEINNLVGGQANYNNVYNCMTRLRFSIKNKELVNEENIKKINLTKGIIWNGNELQVIIGQEVYKVKDEVIKDNEISLGNFDLNSKVKELTLFRRLLQTFAGIMTPIIPAFLSAGMISAIIGILTWVGVMPALGFVDTTQLFNEKWWWVILFVMGKTSSMFIGIIVGYSASKFFDLRRIIGVVIALILCSPILYSNGGEMGMGGEWVIVDFGEIKGITDIELNLIIQKITKLVITGAQFKLFVVIGAIYIAKKLDDWLGKKIPVIIELTIRPFLVILLTCTLTFIILLPLWNIFEGLFGVIMFYIGKLPFGLGVGIYCAIWQICVLFGVHMALGIISSIQIIVSATTGLGGYALFTPGSSISVWAQWGAMVGLMIITKNSALKKQAIGLIPVGILGITEPIIYGINLPRKRVFWSGILAAFIAGLFAGFVGVTGRIQTGIGIFEIIGAFQYPIQDPTGSIGIPLGQLTQLNNGIFYILSCLIAIGASILLTLLFNIERKTEKQSLKFVSAKLLSIMKLQGLINEKNKKEVINIFNEIPELVTVEEQKHIKEIEKKVQRLLKYETQLNSLETKEVNINDKYMEKGKNLIKKNKLKEAEQLIEIMQQKNFDLRKNEIKELISNVKTEIDYKPIDNFVNSKIQDIKNKLVNINKTYNFELVLLQEINNSYKNALNVMRIHYDIDSKEPEYNFAKEIAILKSINKENKSKINKKI